MANHLFAVAIERATLAGRALEEIDAEIVESAVLSQRDRGALLRFADVLRRRGEQRGLAQESLGRA
jgi:hypothetical protein